MAVWGHNELLSKFIDLKKNNMYISNSILRNALTCLYGNETSTFLELDLPTLHNSECHNTQVSQNK